MLIDAHAHLDRYGDALEAALAEIAQHRIFTISNSLDLPSYKRNLEIAESREILCGFLRMIHGYRRLIPGSSKDSTTARSNRMPPALRSNSALPNLCYTGLLRPVPVEIPIGTFAQFVVGDFRYIQGVVHHAIQQDGRNQRC